MPISDPRFSHVAKMVASMLGVTPSQVDAGSKSTLVDEFLAAGDAGSEPRSALVWYYQDGTLVMPGDDVAVPLTGKCVYAIRLSDPMQPLPTKDLEDNLNFGTLSGTGLFSAHSGNIDTFHS